MTRYDWLLLFHLLGAFLFLAGAVAAGILQLAAMRRERPSEIALLLGLTRPAVASVGLGSLVVLVFGLWLAGDLSVFGQAWVIAAIALWVLGNALGEAGGRSLRHTRQLADRLAGAGDDPSAELRSAVANRRHLLLSYASFAAVLAILVLMVWKPGH